jgi:hypothetical protein
VCSDGADGSGETESTFHGILCRGSIKRGSGVRRTVRVNSPNVMHETIEGEVIVIDLGTGSYYSLRDASAEVWHGIETGADEAAISESLHRRYDVSRETIDAAVGKLLDELAGEGLIELIEPDDGGAAALEDAATSLPDANGRVPWAAPVLEKHTDMQDLILLDPVHDVSEAGWPHAAPAGGDA